MNAQEALTTRRGTLLHVEQSLGDLLAGDKTRWIKVGAVSGGQMCAYHDRSSNQYTFFVVWQGAREPFMPVFFRHWESVENVARKRLLMAGLEATAFACDARSWRWISHRKVGWDLLAEVKRCAHGARLWRRRITKVERTED